MSKKPLPPPEWWEEFRFLHVNYGRQYEAIRELEIPEDEKRQRASNLWLATEQHRKQLMKAAIPKLPCTALKSDRERCSKTARPCRRRLKTDPVSPVEN